MSNRSNKPAPRPAPPEGKNRLFYEKSPYLLQHAGNPVDWYPWGDEAFEKAKTGDKPVFLSIGYSTCHWCHVMEHESFENERVASLMNDTFVCIKVDREERPDIDNVYMTACQMITGSGGWPLTVFLTPDRKPFFAATYIPRDAMLDLVPRVQHAWTNERDRLTQSTAEIVDALRGITGGSPGDALGVDHLRTAFEQLGARYDESYGGFGTAPKFPTPHNLTFLLRYWKRTGDAAALAMVENTLDRMRRGGMYDHVGFGFHRYSTDQRWFLPHFEKMLYDQAMLVIAYTDAHLATGKTAYRRTAEEVLGYVLRDMTHPDGGFYSAEDADSEGEEGKFYLWAERELRDLLGADAERVIEVFGVKPEGNWVEESTGHRPGSNILSLERPVAELAAKFGWTGDGFAEWWDPLRRRLFEIREKRVHPYKDDKILTDWNGLMIAALARAARAFDEPRYAESARRAARFVEDRLADPPGGLRHRYRDGEASIGAMVDDYAFFSWGLLELYETTFETKFLESALFYTDLLLDRFWDDSSGGLFFGSDGGERLIVRSKEVYDGAVPSGNSVAALNLVRLARLTARTEYEEKARMIGRAFERQVSRGPSAFTQLLSAVDFILGPTFEVVIAGREGADDTRRLVSTIRGRYLPNKVVVFRPEPDGGNLVDLVPYTREQGALDGAATAYVCRNRACELPTIEVERMLELLGEK